MSEFNQSNPEEADKQAADHVVFKSDPMPDDLSVVPRNLRSILEWCMKFRPDLTPIIWAERNNNAFILLMTVGFEAGRHFQKDHSEFPIDQSHLYLKENDPLLKEPKQQVSTCCLAKMIFHTISDKIGICHTCEKCGEVCEVTV